jgi:rubredoxin
MSDLFLILYSLLTIAVWEFANYLISRIRKPYRWKCKICGWTYKTTTECHTKSRSAVTTTSQVKNTKGEHKWIMPSCTGG